MIENNPPPKLGTPASYYLGHFMTVISEATNGSLPVTRVMDYIDRMEIYNKGLALEIINNSYTEYTKLLNKRAKKEDDKKNIRTRNRS